MFAKFFIFCFLFLNSSKETNICKIINLSDFSFSEFTLNTNLYLEELVQFIEKNNVKQEEKKEKNNFINEYIDDLVLLDDEISLKKEFRSQEFDKKLNCLISKLFFFSTKLLLKSNYILNLNETKLNDDLYYLKNLLKIILNCTDDKDEYFFLNYLIIGVIKETDNLIYLFKNIKTQNDKLNFNDIFKKFLNHIFDFTEKYFCKYFNEILPFLNLKNEKLFFTSGLHFLRSNINENVNIEIFKEYSDYFYQLSDPLIFIEFYVKQIKYFLSNLIFLSILKKDASYFSQVNEIFYNKTFYENLQNFFNSSCLSFCAVGQYIQCFNLNEFLGIRKTGNFFNYKNNLKISDVEDFSLFFLKLIEIYDKNISILNFNEFDIDDFINSIIKLNGEIQHPKEIITILNFIFSYDSYRSDVYTNEENFLYNDEKKGNLDIDESLTNINEFNFKISNKFNDYTCKNTEKNLYKSFNIEHNMFFRLENASFDFLNKKFYLGVGYKINKKDFFLGINIFFDFHFFSFSITYFLKDNVVFSGFIKVYKNFFISFSLSSDKKRSFGVSSFLCIKDTFLDINFNFYF